MFWFRGIVVFFVVLILLRFLGRGLQFQSRPYDVAVQILIGSAAANLIIDETVPLWRAFTSLGTLALLHTLISFLSLWNPIKRILIGEPAVLIENGNIIRSNLVQHQISVEELMAALREKGYFNLADVEFAMIEASGKISVIPRSQSRPVTPKDLGLETRYEGLTTRLITDGVMDVRGLQKIGLTEPWLRQELHRRGIDSPQDVFFCTLDTDGELFIVTMDDIPLLQSVFKGVASRTAPGNPPMVEKEDRGSGLLH